MAATLSPSFFLSASLLVVLATWTKRVFWMSRFRKSHPPIRPRSFDLPSKTAGAPFVSVIIPAKNEEKNIPNCLAHLFRQDYPHMEILVVDDRSSDRTPHLLENFKTLSTKPFKIVRVEKLPAGWTGKNYAMFTGSRAAAGEWLLFTDADTTHAPSSVRAALGHAVENRIDFLTLAPEVASQSFWEKTVQPLAVSSIAFWFSGEVLANGQFLLVKKTVYEKTGGNESVKNEVVEDVELARRARRAGFNVQFLNGTELYSTRMYTSLKEIHAGWTRIFTHLFQKNVFAIAHKIFLFAFFSIFPFAVLMLETFWMAARSPRFDAAIFGLALAVSGAIAAIRAAANRLVKTNPWHGLLHPLGSLVMVWILFSCLGRVLFGRPSVWRGDSYS